MHNKAIFVDRDGVLNEAEVRDGKPFAPRTVADFQLFPDSHDAVSRLKRSGFLIVVVTNQPDIGNGLVAASEIEAMHLRLRDLLPVDDIRVCPHSQSEGCKCRKPGIGMLVASAAEKEIDLTRSWMIGDRSSDVEAGRDAGCFTAFINRGYAIETVAPAANLTAPNLMIAVDRILGYRDTSHRIGDS